MARLPLFPLGTVLFPGARLPLRIFEPRYVALLRDLLDAQDERPPRFGVIAIRDGHEVGAGRVKALHQVGCAALITQVAPLGDNEFFIITEGTERFRLEQVDDDPDLAYVTATVTWLGEPEGDADRIAAFMPRLHASLTDYHQLVGAADKHVPTDPVSLSYAAARSVALDLAERQNLLACPDTSSRLRLANALVRRELALAGALGFPTQPFQPPPLS